MLLGIAWSLQLCSVGNLQELEKAICRHCHLVGVLGERGGEGTLGKDCKYVSTHFWVEDLLTEFVLKAKCLFWSLK